jgi:glycosyltransferase involved in cell wall biosynthesis
MECQPGDARARALATGTHATFRSTRCGSTEPGAHTIDRSMTPHARRVWIATEIYYPEETSTGYILTRLAEGLARRERVAVLCAQPSYERRGLEAPQRERVGGVDIMRVAHPRFDRNRILGRTVNVLVVTARMFLRALREFRAGDTVIVVTNPPALPFAIHAAARIRRASVVLLMHDLYPEAAILAGVLGRSSPLARLWRRATDWLTRGVDRVVVLGRDAAERISARLPDGGRRVRVIGNWADTDDVRPADPAHNPLLQAAGLQGRFVLAYVGNMGRVHDIELLLAAARLLRATAPEVHFLFIGSGAKAGLVSAAAAEPGSNVTMLGPRERSEQDLFLNACHVSVMGLAPGMAGVGVPSRLYNVLAAGRPVLAAVDEDSEPARVLREERIGIQTPPGDVAAFVSAVESLRRDPVFRRDAGLRARQAAVERFGFDKVLDAYFDLLTNLHSEGGRS